VIAFQVNGNAQHAINLLLTNVAYQRIEIIFKRLQVNTIEMAMGVYEHGRTL